MPGRSPSVRQVKVRVHPPRCLDGCQLLTDPVSQALLRLCWQEGRHPSGLLQHVLLLLRSVQPVRGGTGQVVDPPVMGQGVVDHVQDGPVVVGQVTGAGPAGSSSPLASRLSRPSSMPRSA